MTISSYIERHSILVNTHFKITTEGKGYFIEGDKQYTREEFNRKYPLPLQLYINVKTNADKSKGWLQVD